MIRKRSLNAIVASSWQLFELGQRLEHRDIQVAELQGVNAKLHARLAKVSEPIALPKKALIRSALGLGPLRDLILASVLRSFYLRVDETTARVLRPGAEKVLAALKERLPDRSLASHPEHRSEDR